MPVFRIIADHLPRFMTCNGSRLLAAPLPPAVEDNNNARREGIAAHYMATAAFRGAPLEEMVDRKAPNGFYMTAHMAESAGDYLDHIRKDAGFAGMEVDTSHDNIDASGNGWIIDGRADYVGMHTQTELHIVDYKYGWRIVEPDENWTMISHAIGHIRRNKLQDGITSVRFSVFQPRPHHPDGQFRSWVISIEQLNSLFNVLNDTLWHPSDLVVTSPHCHLCPALVPCNAARSAEMNSIDVAEQAHSDNYTDAELSFQLDNLARAKKMLEDRLDAFQELAKHRITQGAVINNYAAEMGQGNRRFKDGITAQILQAMTGQDFTAPAKLITPAEAERRGIDKVIIGSLTERPPTGIRLVRASANKRATKLFGERKES